MTRKMNKTERTAWLSFVATVANFLRNKNAENYQILVAVGFCNLECKMSATSMDSTVILIDLLKT